MTPQDRQKLDAALVVLEEIKRSLASLQKRVDGIEKNIREIAEKDK